jgi:hypothetical protein
MRFERLSGEPELLSSVILERSCGFYGILRRVRAVSINCGNQEASFGVSFGMKRSSEIYM